MCVPGRRECGGQSVHGIEPQVPEHHDFGTGVDARLERRRVTGAPLVQAHRGAGDAVVRVAR